MLATGWQWTGRGSKPVKPFGQMACLKRIKRIVPGAQEIVRHQEQHALLSATIVAIHLPIVRATEM